MAETCDAKKVFELVAKLYEEHLDGESGQLKKEKLKNAVLDTMDPETREKCQAKLEVKMKRGGKKGKGKKCKGGQGGQEKKGDGPQVNMGEFRCFMRMISMGVLQELKCDDDDDSEEECQQE